MDPATENERPVKRVRRDEVGSTSTNPPVSRGDEDSDIEVVAYNNVAHGSDLYLDTVRITSSAHPWKLR